MNPIIQPLIEEITNTNTLLASATKFVNGVPALVQAAIDKATENGATAAQLEPFTALKDALVTERTALADALIAQTPQDTPEAKSRRGR